MERPPAVHYLAPRLNFRFAFFCSRSCASRRFASSTARSTSFGPKARFTRSKSATVPRRALGLVLQLHFLQAVRQPLVALPGPAIAP